MAGAKPRAPKSYDDKKSSDNKKDPTVGDTAEQN